jgi:hypothetical protein
MRCLVRRHTLNEGRGSCVEAAYQSVSDWPGPPTAIHEPIAARRPRREILRAKRTRRPCERIFPSPEYSTRSLSTGPPEIHDPPIARARGDTLDMIRAVEQQPAGLAARVVNHEPRSDERRDFFRSDEVPAIGQPRDALRVDARFHAQIAPRTIEQRHEQASRPRRRDNRGTIRGHCDNTETSDGNGRAPDTLDIVRRGSLANQPRLLLEDTNEIGGASVGRHTRQGRCREERGAAFHPRHPHTRNHVRRSRSRPGSRRTTTPEPKTALLERSSTTGASDSRLWTINSTAPAPTTEIGDRAPVGRERRRPFVLSIGGDARQSKRIDIGIACAAPPDERRTRCDRRRAPSAAAAPIQSALAQACMHGVGNSGNRTSP